MMRMNPDVGLRAWLHGSSLALLLAAMLSATPALLAAPSVAKCPGQCVSASSIVHAAGVPPGVQQALEKISFEGTRLADASKDALAQLATEAKALPAKAVVKVSVAADSGLSAADARKQAAARIKALGAGLKQAGVPAKQFKLSAAR